MSIVTGLGLIAHRRVLVKQAVVRSPTHYLAAMYHPPQPAQQAAALGHMALVRGELRLALEPVPGPTAQRLPKRHQRAAALLLAARGLHTAHAPEEGKADLEHAQGQTAPLIRNQKVAVVPKLCTGLGAFVQEVGDQERYLPTVLTAQC